LNVRLLQAMKLFHQTLAKNAKAILAEGFKAAQLTHTRGCPSPMAGRSRMVPFRDQKARGNLGPSWAV